ncbi:MAG: MarR family transcriptional regulator [Chloroflexi bacterium]|jgi:DNA-binding MarR family transcriptional regulator|nr:MarR family transcriptional regulator [Chloroflexota bacterium]
MPYKQSTPLLELKKALSSSILDLDRLVQRLVRAGWPEAWQQINLPLGATRALLLIEAGRANNPRTVADALGVSRTTVTGLIDRLEQDGLITRSIMPDDKRSFALNLTEKGHQLVVQIENIRRQTLSVALERMDESDLKTLRSGLEALANAMLSSLPEENPGN